MKPVLLILSIAWLVDLAAAYSSSSSKLGTNASRKPQAFKATAKADSSSNTQNDIKNIPFAVPSNPDSYLGYHHSSPSSVPRQPRIPRSAKQSLNRWGSSKNQQYYPRKNVNNQGNRYPYAERPRPRQAPRPPSRRFSQSPFDTGYAGYGYGDNSYGSPDVSYGYTRYPYPWGNSYYGHYGGGYGYSAWSDWSYDGPYRNQSYLQHEGSVSYNGNSGTPKYFYNRASGQYHTNPEYYSY